MAGLERMAEGKMVLAYALKGLCVLDSPSVLRGCPGSASEIRDYREHVIQVRDQLAFTRCSFPSSRVCTNQTSFHSPRPPALPTLV